EQYAITNEGSQNDWYWRVGVQKDIIGSYKDGHGVRIPQHGNSHTASFMVGNTINDKNDVKIAYDTYRGDVMYSDHLGALNHIRYGNEANDSLRAIWNNKISNRWSHQLYLMNNHYKTTYDGYLTDVKTRGIGDQVTYKAKDHTVVVGFDWRQDKVVNMGGVKLTNASYFIQDEWKFAPKWTVTPGIRVDHHSSFGTHTSPSISLGYDVNEKTNVYAAYKEYFLAPTPYQLFDGYNGNRNLKPETGHEFDLGVHHKFGKTWNGNLSFFSRSTKDKIGWVMTDPATFTGQYRNFDTEKARGVNAEVRKQINNHLSARLGYTYTHIDATPTRKANRDGYVPKHAVNAGLDYNNAKWDAHLDIRGVIDRPGPADNIFPRTTYWLADISANYRVRENVTVFGRVNNIFDTYYAEQSNVRWGNPGDWWPGQGRNFRL
ncbi:MAG: TonB-dependent receptor, partial [Veillonella sp.]